jgi:hypothetical protein
MKKLILIILLVLLSACTPDENTSQDIQDWYDACEEITSCSDKLDEMRELELSESAIILEIQNSLEDQQITLDEYGLVLQDHEERISALEASIELDKAKKKQLDDFLIDSKTVDYINDLGGNLNAIAISQESNIIIIIDDVIGHIPDFEPTENFDDMFIDDMIENMSKDLKNVVDASDITITFYKLDDSPVVYNLIDIIK